MKASIVIPAYRPTSLLQMCLSGIVQNTHLENIEVIVVCNGSDKDSAELVLSLGHPFRLVWYTEALGFTKAANVGLRLAREDIVILLNTDAVILDFAEKDVWLDRLLNPLMDANVGIAGLGAMWTEFGFYVPFYCTAVKRKLFEEFGYLDEKFSPGYCEDADFCYRVRKEGYEIVQVDKFQPDEDRPNMTVTDFPIWHAGEQSFQDKELRHQSIHRGISLLQEKWGNK